MARLATVTYTGTMTAQQLANSIADKLDIPRGDVIAINSKAEDGTEVITLEFASAELRQRAVDAAAAPAWRESLGIGSMSAPSDGSPAPAPEDDKTIIYAAAAGGAVAVVLIAVVIAVVIKKRKGAAGTGRYHDEYVQMSAAGSHGTAINV